ncbi:MAG: EamA family transporter [Gammaproteobacteria bacterium]|jgi:drug/metabolite transporter (DMT)-like permease|nr:EamA family transporter [Gammaproteobacteria bacterium]MDX2461512.1 EamA family transporter [Gammaproteobacteria bacterium]
MTSDPFVLGLVLFSALMHAAWNTVIKTGGDGLLMFAVVKAPTMVIAVLVLAVVGPPSMASVPYAIGSAVGFTAYCFLLVWAYRVGDLNFVYPVARGSAPLGVALLSGLLLGEHLSGPGLVGILIISAGIAALAYHPQTFARHIPDLLRAASVGLCIAIYTLFDGVGARISDNVLGYTAMTSFLAGIPLMIIAFFLRGREMVGFLRHEWKSGILGGVMMFAAYAIVIYAMTLTQLTQVAALRETSVIFAAVIGTLILKESLGVKRIFAATIVAGGIILVALSGL